MTQKKNEVKNDAGDLSKETLKITKHKICGKIDYRVELSRPHVTIWCSRYELDVNSIFCYNGDIYIGDIFLHDGEKIIENIKKFS